METLAALVVVLPIPVVALAIAIRQIRRRPQDDTFLQDEDHWGAQ